MPNHIISVALKIGITKGEAQEIASAIRLFGGVKSAEVCTEKHPEELPRSCASGNHYTNDVCRGRDFYFCPDCGKRLD